MKENIASLVLLLAIPAVVISILSVLIYRLNSKRRAEILEFAESRNWSMEKTEYFEIWKIKGLIREKNFTAVCSRPKHKTPGQNNNNLRVNLEMNLAGGDLLIEPKGLSSLPGFARKAARGVQVDIYESAEKIVSEGYSVSFEGEFARHYSVWVSDQDKIIIPDRVRSLLLNLKKSRHVPVVVWKDNKLSATFSFGGNYPDHKTIFELADELAAVYEI